MKMAMVEIERCLRRASCGPAGGIWGCVGHGIYASFGPWRDVVGDLVVVFPRASERAKVGYGD